MTPAEDLIKHIIRWAKEKDDIRAAILLGSRTRKGTVDQLSDIDLDLISTEPTHYFENDTWLQQFGTVWLSIQDQDSSACKVIYEDGLMVEFFFVSSDAITTLYEKLPEHYERGYKILLDKDKLARRLPKASGLQPTPSRPTEKQFTDEVEVFWWDAFQYVKYLWRDELWRCKHYDWQLKQHLLKMMGWHALLCRNQTHFTTYQGTHLKGWVDPEVYIRLMSAFGRFYPADSWRALDETTKIYANLAEEVAQVLNVKSFKPLQEQFVSWKNDLIDRE
jgi:aminoglycoside 6-adenylyltransferase